MGSKLISNVMHEKITKILLLTTSLVLSGCVGAAVGTMGTIESRSDHYLQFKVDQPHTKENVIKQLGAPTREFAEGKCEVICYETGRSLSGVWVYAGIIPIPIAVPTGKKEDKLYFKNGQFITAVTESNEATYSLGFMLTGELEDFYFLAGRVDLNGLKIPPSPIEKDWCE